MLNAEQKGRKRHRLIGLAGAAGAALIVAACGSSSGTPAGSSGSSASSGSGSSGTSSQAASSSAPAGKSGSGTGTLTIAATSGPISLDPTLSSNGIPQVWYPNLSYESLIERSADGKPEPGLATSWGYSKNRLSFHLNLRKGVKFSDGSTMTAKDVVASLQRYQKKGDITQWLANAKSITATGPLQVTIKLASPNPLLPYGLDQDGMAGDIIGPKGLANTASLGSSSDGAGPYMIDAKQTIANSQYVYVKNPYYYDKSAQHYSKITIKIISNGNSVLAALQSNEVQVAEGDATNASQAQSAGLNVTAAPSALVGVYIGDQEGKIVPALKSEKVRQALSLAVNRVGITRSLYGKYATPTDQAVPSKVSGYVPSLEKKFAYNPTKAKALLKQAGYPHGFSMDLIEQPSVDSGDLLAQAIAQDWKAIGVNTTIKTSPSFSAYVSQIEGGKIPATTFTFQYSVQLVDTLQLINTPALYNYLSFKEPEAIKLATDEQKYDIGSPQGTKAAQAAESFMTTNGNIVGVSATQALLFSTKAVGNLGFGTYPWSDPSDWEPAGS